MPEQGMASAISGVMVRFLQLTSLLALLSPLALWGQSAQIEQARQQTTSARQATPDGFADFPDFTLAPTPAPSAPRERATPFSAFAEVSALMTNNVALSRGAKEEDRFFVATTGAAYRQPITPQLEASASVRSSIYRYDRFPGLDFQSIDFSFGPTWTPAQLGGVELRLRYYFTDLTDRHGDEFYRNHAVLLGAQKSFAIAKAHALYGGVNAEWDWSNPKSAERDAYSVFAGYRVQATRKIDADLYYRYARYRYSDYDGRQDNNQVVAMTWRYEPVEWASLSATSYFTWNRSTQSQFNYDAFTVGVAVQVSVNF
jgi:hypothetical protein